MPKPVTIPFGEWRPDASDLDTPFLSVAKNVLPHPNGYIRMGSFATQAAIVPATPFGAAFAHTYTSSDPLIAFTGTATKLYRTTSLSSGFTDVSRLVGGNCSGVSLQFPWSFAQFGAKLIAAQVNNATQIYSDVSTATNFAALGGSPPQARGVSVCGDFVVLWGLSTDKSAIHWSDVNDATNWSTGLATRSRSPTLVASQVCTATKSDMCSKNTVCAGFSSCPEM